MEEKNLRQKNVHMYEPVCVRMRVSASVHVVMHVCVHVYTCTRARMHVHMYVCVCFIIQQLTMIKITTLYFISPFSTWKLGRVECWVWL